MRELSSMSMGRGVAPFAALERTTLFDGLGHGELTGVAMLMRPRTFAPGEELCRAGEVGESLLVIVNGLVHVVAATGESRETRVIAKRRRGDVVGATSLVAGEPNFATVVAGMPTEALELSRIDFEKLIERFPLVLRNVSRILGRRIAETTGRATQVERGEAVALIVAPSLAGAVGDLQAASEAASARPVAWLDTRTGFDAAVGQLDDALAESGTVVVTARAQGRSAPLLLDHVDRAVILVDDPGEAQRFAGRATGERVEVVLVSDGRPAPQTVGGLPVVRALARRDGTIAPPELAWLGRHLTGTKLGLALGAGGAKGFAHVGLLQVLEEAGYVVDYVAGSSIGAIVGAFIALGMDAAEIDRTMRETFTADVVADVFKLSLAGGSSGLETMERVFRETMGDRTFADTVIPLAIMSVDLTTREPAPIRSGPLWEALMAATALAGMFPPYERNGHRLVDGLALVPVPTGSVIEDGADVTVSVNLVGRETLPAWPGEEPPPAPKRKRGSRMLENLLEVMDLMQLDTGIRHAEMADVVVTPVFGPGSWRDFHLADLFLEGGRRAAEERLPELQGLARPQLTEAPT
jgi:predicted acylesterase/phospholipase RssA/CRP-like cAMP-binding protein